MVFHRYAGKTMPARAAETDALTERARRAAKRVNVDVALVTGTVALLPPLADRRDHILDSLRKDLVRQLDTARPRKQGAAARP
ncbi:hypothetical protein RKD27_000080 [Streptomyces sp. SAI-126]